MVNWRFNPCEVCCQVCTSCCEGFDDPPDDIVVDLGVGGLTDAGDCSGGDCELVAGEWTISKASFFDDNCLWSFVEQSFCGFITELAIFVRVKIDENSECYWEVTVKIDSNIGEPDGTAVYESAHGEFSDCDLASPLSLSKQSEDWSTFCNGALPATITIEAAP
jgi:hypothetical protein